MKKTLLVSLIAFFAMMLSGCGSNDFDTHDGNVTSTMVLSVETPAGGTYAITEADHDYSVVLKAMDGNETLTGKVVKITTADFVGSFSAQQATTDETGKATFAYHSPGSVDVNTTFTVTFALEEDANVSTVVSFKIGSGGGNTDTNTTVDKINYGIIFEPADGAFNLPLGNEHKKSANIKLINIDTNATIDNSKVRNIKITSKDPTVMKLTPEDGGLATSEVTFNGNNDVTIQMVPSETVSGLAPLVISITYVDLNGNKKTMTTTYSMSVLAGPPSAFSINSAGISYNFDTKQFEHKFLIQAVDNSGNPIASEGIINVSAMASFAKDAGGREMLYGRHAKDTDGISATLSSVNNKGQVVMAGITPFDAAHVDKNRAFVALFGNVNTYEANGKWNIDSLLGNDSLGFNNQYLGVDYSGLGLAVGYNYRDKFCSSGYEESVVIVDSTDGTYVLNKEGKAFVTLKFDPYMIGKRVAILVNMVGYDPATGELRRSGEVHFNTESFVEYLKGGTIKVPKGSTITAGIWGIIDTGTNDEWVVRNSTFSCEIELQDAHITGGPFRNDPASCDSGGAAFLQYTVSADAADKDGSITFSKCQVNSAPTHYADGF